MEQNYIQLKLNAEWVQTGDKSIDLRIDCFSFGSIWKIDNGYIVCCDRFNAHTREIKSTQEEAKQCLIEFLEKQR